MEDDRDTGAPQEDPLDRITAEQLSKKLKANIVRELNRGSTGLTAEIERLMQLEERLKARSSKAGDGPSEETDGDITTEGLLRTLRAKIYKKIGDGEVNLAAELQKVRELEQQLAREKKKEEAGAPDADGDNLLGYRLKNHPHLAPIVDFMAKIGLTLPAMRMTPQELQKTRDGEEDRNAFGKVMATRTPTACGTTRRRPSATGDTRCTTARPRWARRRSRREFGPMFEFYLYTGLRVAELTRLDWRDIRLSEGVLLVREAKDAEERLVPIAPRLREVIEEMGPATSAGSSALVRGMSPVCSSV